MHVFDTLHRASIYLASITNSDSVVVDIVISLALLQLCGDLVVFCCCFCDIVLCALSCVAEEEIAGCSNFICFLCSYVPYSLCHGLICDIRL